MLSIGLADLDSPEVSSDLAISKACPECNTRQFLLDAKECAESTPQYTSDRGTGTGVDIWERCRETALRANQRAAEKALLEIGPVRPLTPDSLLLTRERVTVDKESLLSVIRSLTGDARFARREVEAYHKDIVHGTSTSSIARLMADIQRDGMF
ncbi:hypothetical protein A3709_18810 [Halioglobus sp. HI00S01]|nr:hypothetical protein A3709_18810 [Halioglobus sp. HI00S01]